MKPFKSCCVGVGSNLVLTLCFIWKILPKLNNLNPGLLLGPYTSHEQSFQICMIKDLCFAPKNQTKSLMFPTNTIFLLFTHFLLFIVIENFTTIKSKVSSDQLLYYNIRLIFFINFPLFEFKKILCKKK